ncbi:hypothetical protein Daura_17150 [Dactylosporangium aurantiacum]|uniref:Uncharacterized protein n=1 Tax=Dactylosporangium aurantiacum TaxID=35754 RepID=A0A9Q9IKB3_9ACTN|nr:hypothetical protein [Dactylosporangium aurantiacum]MDG6103234.1 hypothetical protein [Dactylosporangium aurantiacum]UWZ57737.1 hypothetical protein Daura_17150 [Dactylosporangium aurantiacum]
MDLIASADASADNILDYSVTPACQAYVIGEHVVRIPRCQVLAVANLSNHQPPAFPFPRVPSAPPDLRAGAHASVGLRDGATGAWDHTVLARAESDDCRAVSFRVYVEQGWAGVTGLVFRTGAVLPGSARVELESHRIVFDAVTGLIFFAVTTSRAAEAEADDTDPDEYALTTARDLAPDGLHLRVRSLDRPLPPGRSFRVDPDTGAVIEVRSRAQP